MARSACTRSPASFVRPACISPSICLTGAPRAFPVVRPEMLAQALRVMDGAPAVPYGRFHVVDGLLPALPDLAGVVADVPDLLLDLLGVMALGRLQSLVEDLVSLVQELLSGLRDVQRLVELLVTLSGPLADLMRDVSERRVVAEHVAHLAGNCGDLLQTRVHPPAHRDALVQRRLDLREARIDPPASPDGLLLVLLDRLQAVLDGLRRIPFVRRRRRRPPGGVRFRPDGR